MGTFTGTSNATVSKQGNFFDPGFIGRLKVRSVEKINPSSGEAFIVNFEVIESNLEKFPVGGKGTWYQKMVDLRVALPAIRAWGMATCGFEADQKNTPLDELEDNGDTVLECLLEAAIDSPYDNAFIGRLIDLETITVKTKKGFDFTRHEWSPVEDQ